MSSSCKCFSETLEKVKEHVKGQINGDFVDFSASWEGEMIFFSGDHVPVNPKVAISYRKIKKDKTPAKNLTKDSLTITCRYCPFCGRELERSK